MLEDFKIFSWVQFQIHTGRTHQIRVHAKHIGHPVVCDELYGDGKPILLSTLKHKFKLSKNELEERTDPQPACVTCFEFTVYKYKW